MAASENVNMAIRMIVYYMHKIGQNASKTSRNGRRFVLLTPGRAWRRVVAVRANPLLSAALRKAKLPVPTEFFLFDTATGELRFNRAGRIFYGSLVGWSTVAAGKRLTVQELFSILSANLQWVHAATLMHMFGLSDEDDACANESVTQHVRAIHELAEFLETHGHHSAYLAMKSFAIECDRVHTVPGGMFAGLRQLQRELRTADMEYEA